MLFPKNLNLRGLLVPFGISNTMDETNISTLLKNNRRGEEIFDLNDEKLVSKAKTNATGSIFYFEDVVKEMVI